MACTVQLTRDAIRDLDEMFDYIAERDAPRKAAHVIGRIGREIAGLTEFPNRGICPKELLQLGLSDFRQIYFKPYRVIYRVVGKDVYVYLIADGRRDMQTLLERRMLDT